MPVDWEREAPRLAKLARLDLAPEETHALALACEAITRDFGALAEYARSIPAPPDEPAGPLRPDAVAPASAAEVEGIVRAIPAFDPVARTVIVPRGLP